MAGLSIQLLLVPLSELEVTQAESSLVATGLNRQSLGVTGVDGLGARSRGGGPLLEAHWAVGCELVNHRTKQHPKSNQG